MQPGDVLETFADISDLMRDTGFAPSDTDRGGCSRLCRVVSRALQDLRRRWTERIIPLIMCGGAGTRLWPASREVRPKQFLPLFGARSTFQDTLLRVSDAALFARPIVITNAAYRFMVLEQLAEIGVEADVLLEPVRRDSGPAIAAGAAFASAREHGCGGACARRRPRGARRRGLHRGLPAGTGGRKQRPDRDLRHQAGAGRDRIRLHQSGRGRLRRGAGGQDLRREAGPGDRRGLHQERLSLEQRQLHVPRLRAD